MGNRPLFDRVQILNHYPDQVERDKINVIVTGSSLDQIQLSPDNFVQADYGYAVQAKVTDDVATHEGYFLSWVRDDLSTEEAITNRVDPGVYYLTLDNVTDESATLLIDVLRVVKREVVLFNYAGETQAQLENFPVLEGTFQLFVDNALYPPDDPADYYDIDLATGVITFNREPPPGSQVTANYNWIDEPLPEVSGLQRGIGRTDILPGVLLGFSEEFVAGDRAVVIVSEEREINALTFGGRQAVSLQFDTRSQDTVNSEKLVTVLVDTLWGLSKPILRDEGIDLIGVTVGGEAVDPEDEIGQEWAFQFNVSADFETEWQRRIPLLRRYSHGVVNCPPDIDLASATDDELVEASLLSVEGAWGPTL